MPPQVADPAPEAALSHRRNASSLAIVDKSGGGDDNNSNNKIAMTPTHKRSNSLDSKIRKLFITALRKGGTRCLFKSKFTRPKTPVDVVRQTTFLLSYINSSPITSGPKYADKIEELDFLMREMKMILYGTGDAEPSADACAQLTQEFFKEDTLRVLILCLPKLDLEGRKDATQVVANLQRQPVHSRLIASDHLEANLDLIDILLSGYDDPAMALHYGGMLRECIRHQTVARYILQPEHVGKFFDYIQLPNFDVAADAATTFKELLTRHKSTVSEFLSKNYDWFFDEFNSKLLESTNYITRRQAVKLLGEILLDRSNSAVMVRYVSSKNNLRILMNLLRESSKSIQFDAFHVFKIFVANENKPPDIVNILVANRSKLLRLFSGLVTNKEDEAFEADKAWVVGEISELVATASVTNSGELIFKRQTSDIKFNGE